MSDPSSSADPGSSGSPEEESVSGTNSKILSVTKNFFGRACFWAIVYSIGYYKFSVFWIFIPLSVNYFLFKLGDDGDGDDADEDLEHKPINSVTDLPRWVYFPDTDRAEWLNKLVGQLWPALQEHVTIRYTIEWLRDKVPSFCSGGHEVESRPERHIQVFT